MSVSSCPSDASNPQMHFQFMLSLEKTMQTRRRRQLRGGGTQLVLSQRREGAATSPGRRAGAARNVRRVVLALLREC